MFAPALMRRATLLAIRGQHEDALACFDRVIALPSETDSFYAKAHVLRGNSLRQLGEFRDAIENYDTALDLNPRHLDARNSRSVLLATLGRNEEAEAEARLILSIDPQNGAAYNSLGNALQRQGRIAEALESFRAAIRLVADPIPARFNYSMCLLLAGDFANGWREYEARWQGLGWNVGWDVTPRPSWHGEKDIAGQTMMLYSEQGLGIPSISAAMCRWSWPWARG